MAVLLFMRKATVILKVGAATAIQFQGQVSTAAVETEAGDTVSYPVLDGTNPTQVGPESYALHLVAAQDWTAATGLATFLWTNAGASATFWLYAYDSTGSPTADKPAVTGTVTLVAPTYGGEVNTYAELDVTLPCSVKPTLATSGPPPTALLAEEEEEAAQAAEEAAKVAAKAK
jgi:hypothetical protein